MLIFGKSKEIYKKIETYMSVSLDLFEIFTETINDYVKNNFTDKYFVNMEKIKTYEENCDNILHTIQKELYKKSLLPDLRNDILILLESVDDIIDQTLDAIQLLYIKNIIIPDTLDKYFLEILDANIEAFEYVNKSVKEIFMFKNNIKEYCIKISNLETICDNIEFKVIRKIYTNSTINDFNKILLEDAFKNLIKISDLCDSTADILTLINIKRSI